MERVKLSKNEKKVFRLLNNGYQCPSTMPSHVFAKGAEGLEQYGFARCAWCEGHILEQVTITDKGKVYIALYPSLRNPIDWKWIITISIIAAIASIIALFVACKVV